MNESGLKQLFEFIKGDKGAYKFLGPGIHTYPTRNDKQDLIHNAYLELEAHGLIHRETDKPDHVFWVAKHASEFNIILTWKILPESDAEKIRKFFTDK